MDLRLAVLDLAKRHQLSADATASLNVLTGLNQQPPQLMRYLPAGIAILGAVANVMGMVHLVSSSRAFCVATTPTSYKRYSSAADAWSQRNAAVVAHKEKVMSFGDQRLVANALSGDMVRQTEEMLRPVRGAGTAEKVAWCDKAFADVNRGALDLVGRASIEPLMRYHPR